jgi:hypothetical protein
MQSRHVLLIVPVLMAMALVGTSCAYEYKAQATGTELLEKIRKAAVTGAPRQQVVQTLESDGLPFKYSASSRVIVSPWMPIGRFRLFWETQFFYQINFDEADRVIGFKTEKFNEGL